MCIIPDSPENTPHQSKPLPHSAVHTSQPRRRLRGRRPRATRTPSRVQTPHAHAACCTLHRMRVAGILWESLVVGRVVASARSTDAGGRSLSPTRRHPTEACRQATPAWPRAPKPSGWDDQRPRRWSPRLGAAPNPRRARSRSAAERDHSEKINPATQPRRSVFSIQ
jgi:hypothetical protein